MDIPTVQQLTGLNPLRAPADPAPMQSVARSAGPGAATSDIAPWHADSPLFWFGLIAAVTVGLVGVSTSARLGPLRGSVSAGTT